MKYESIKTDSGRTTLFSVEEFYEKIVLENHCFICGAPPRSKEFNNEHILPDWLLAKYQLHSQIINLPNQLGQLYGKYTIPCCKDCNSELGDNVEIPMSRLLKLPYNEFSSALTDSYQNISLLFQWLNLIFLKTHLKDMHFYWSMDKRTQSVKIGTSYVWEAMHHVHCIARAHYSAAQITPQAMGSIFVIPGIQHVSIPQFYFHDNTAAQTILFRMDEKIIICVLNDSCAVFNVLTEILQKITSPVTHFQMCELFAIVTHCNLSIKNRPVFFSEISDKSGYQIKADLPHLEFDNIKAGITIGELLYFHVKDMIDENDSTRQFLAEIKENKRTYLFDANGEFVDHGNDLKLAT
ncbi:MAG: hypothetical protein BGO21_09845 [Dyadobacter sp. 50-39]|uniref:hypothetical protein n=1 Tax=Dyadobacter sp. 50-39 TaxID=1895756 RepID=UPI00095EAB90|nr:hypothetical protein [Dyadobacter sp. 50-39]OJV21172.1 MAG: hypothetical protein BGO21_09845 [Dyadobacter sp. 50-39]